MALPWRHRARSMARGLKGLHTAIGAPRLDDEVEALSSARPDRAEVVHVAGGQAVYAYFFGKRDHRGVYKAEAEVGVLPIDVHRSALLPKEVIHLRQHQARDVPGSRPIDRIAKSAVVWRRRGQIIEERAG